MLSTVCNLSSAEQERKFVVRGQIPIICASYKTDIDVYFSDPELLIYRNSLQTHHCANFSPLLGETRVLILAGYDQVQLELTKHGHLPLRIFIFAKLRRFNVYSHSNVPLEGISDTCSN